MSAPANIKSRFDRMAYLDHTVETSVFSLHFQQILHNDAPHSIWFQVTGPEGCGKSVFLHALAEQLREKGLPVFFLHGALLPHRRVIFWQQLLRAVRRTYREDFERYLASLPPRIGQLLARRSFTDAQDTLLRHVAYGLLQFLSKPQPVFFLLDEIPRDGQREAYLWEMISQLRHLPLRVVSAERHSISEHPSRLPFEQILLGHLSQMETEQFVARQWQVSPLLARFITNRLFLKSQGNPRKILWLLQAYFAAWSGAQQISRQQVAALQKIRLMEGLDQLLPRVYYHLPEQAQKLLPLLAVLDDPLPLEYLGSGPWGKLNRSVLENWVARGWLDRISLFQQRAYMVLQPEWRAYLRQKWEEQPDLEVLLWLQKRLQKRRQEGRIQLSPLLFAVGKESDCLRSALAEIRVQWKSGQFVRMVDRLRFLERQGWLTGLPEKERNALFLQLSEGYRDLGLNANALNALQQLRERLQPSPGKIWGEVHLQMAELLLSMDQFPEARYFLQSVAGSRRLPGEQQVRLWLLYGDLERALGRLEYAHRYYLRAAEKLPGRSPSRLVGAVFERLKPVYASGRFAPGKQIALLEELQNKIAHDQELRCWLELEKLKIWLQLRRVSRIRKSLSELPPLIEQSGNPDLQKAFSLWQAEWRAMQGQWRMAWQILEALYQEEYPYLSLEEQSTLLLKRAIAARELGEFSQANQLLQDIQRLVAQFRLSERLSQEARLHQGHIQLLVHNDLLAREYLQEVLDWAEIQGERDLAFAAALWLGWYEALHGRYAQMARQIALAEELHQPEKYSIDWFNLKYYQFQYLLFTGQLKKAWSLLQEWRAGQQGIGKYQMLGDWMQAQWAARNGQAQQAIHFYRKGLKKALRMQARYYAFQMQKELCALLQEEGLPWEQALKEAEQLFQQLLACQSDPILRHQLAESREQRELERLNSRQPTALR